VPILMQIPGINTFGALAILSELGEVTRFASPKKPSSYAGLVPSLHRSGQKNSSGAITKAGRSRLRWVMVEAAHVAVVATARKMLVIIWHLLSGDGVYRGRRVEMVARKFLQWGWKVGEQDRCGSKSEFILERLHQIEINGLTHIKVGRRAYSLSEMN